MEREPSLQTLLTCESQENVNTGNFVCAAAEMSGPSHTEVNPCFYYTAFLPFFRCFFGGRGESGVFADLARSGSQPSVPSLAGPRVIGDELLFNRPQTRKLSGPSEAAVS